MSEFYAARALDATRSSYGEKYVSILGKDKPLEKFGRASLAGAGIATIMELPGSEVNETFVEDNLITHIVSDSASDTGPIDIEGHTIASDLLSFSVQTPILQGLTPVPLATPLCRATRFGRDALGTLASPTANLVGNVYAYASGETSVVGGVPQTNSAVKLMVVAGEQGSFKGSTALSSTDYWLLTEVFAGMQRAGGSARADVWIEYRRVGGVWRRLGLNTMSLRSDGLTFIAIEPKPWAIIPKNSDVRMRVDASAACDIFCSMRGLLATTDETARI